MPINDTNYYFYITPPNETCYCMPNYQMAEIQNDVNKGSFKDWAVGSLFSNTSSYFVSWMYFPFDVSKFINTFNMSPVIGKKVGKYNNVHLMSTQQNNPPVKEWFNFTINRYFNNFLDYEPYTKIRIFIPFFGMWDLPLEQIYGKKVVCYLTFDAQSGNLNCAFYIDNGRYIMGKTIKIGIEITMGVTNAEEIKRNNLLQAISFGGNLLGLGIGLSAGNPLITAGSVNMLSRNVTTALQNNVDRLQDYKQSGSFADLSIDRNIYMVVERPQNVNVPDVHITGKPFEQSITLQSLSGFTKVGEIHFNPMNNETITSEEITEIVSLLKDGVHL